MAGKLSDTDEEITDINVTPFVDVMLVLLVIFMVTASYITRARIDINLPDASTAEGGEEKALAFTVDKDSNVFIDGERVLSEDLDSRLQQEKAKSGTISAEISADKATPHGSVIKLIDTMRKNGINDFAIAVERTK